MVFFIVSCQLESHAIFDIFFEEKSKQLKQGFDLIALAEGDGRTIDEGLRHIASAMNKSLAFESKEAFSAHVQAKKTLVF